jgi:hypothetical protein
VRETVSLAVVRTKIVRRRLQGGDVEPNEDQFAFGGAPSSTCATSPARTPMWRMARPAQAKKGLRSWISRWRPPTSFRKVSWPLRHAGVPAAGRAALEVVGENPVAEGHVNVVVARLDRRLPWNVVVP